MLEAVRSRKPHLLFAASAMLLVLAILLGGGQGTLGDTTVQLLALGVLALLVLQRRGPARLPPWIWLPVIAVVAIPALQLLPLPASLWAALGARPELAAQLMAADVAPPARIGLNPTGSERALAWLMPGVALYLAAFRLSSRQQGWLVTIILCLAVVSVALGLAQLAGGRTSPLRFYAHTNPGGMVGFFANRNHAAALFALCLPLAIAMLADACARWTCDRPTALMRGLVAAGLVLLLTLGLGMAGSRAGLLVGMLATVVTLPVLLRFLSGWGKRRIIPIAGLAAILLAMQCVLLAVALRFDADPLDDRRRDFVGPTLEAAAAYAPLGSGLGTFRQAYPPFEQASAVGAGNTIVNHAHNDYLEIWMEAGWPGILCMLGLVGTLAYAATRPMTRDETVSHAQWLQRRIVPIALLVPAVHSLFDYPLRTTAHIALFGLLAGIVVAGATRTGSSRRTAEST